MAPSGQKTKQSEVVGEYVRRKGNTESYFEKVLKNPPGVVKYCKAVQVHPEPVDL